MFFLTNLSTLSCRGGWYHPLEGGGVAMSHGGGWGGGGGRV